MNGRFWITNSFLTWVGFCLGSNSPQPFPPCNQPLNEIIRVNMADNVDFSSSFYEDYYHSTYWSAQFAFIHKKGVKIICRSETTASCSSEIDPHFRITVIKGIKRFAQWKKTYRFHITISKTDYSDNGVYYVQSYYPFCTILRISIIVRNPLPSCTALVVNAKESLKLSCRWMLHESGDMMKLIARNKTLQLYEFISGMDTLGFCWIAPTVISTTIAIQDAFDKDLIPDSCIVSNAQLEFERRCNFSVFTSPKTNEITKFGEKVLFTCCTDSENVPSIRWQSMSTNPINATGQFLTVNIDTFRQGSGVGMKTAVFFSCGGHSSADMQTSFRIGKVVFNLQYKGSVLLFWKIKPDRSSIVAHDEETCTWPHLVTITAEPVEYEQSIGSTLQGSISNTEEVTYSTQALSTSPEQTGSSLYFPNNNLPRYPLVPSQASYYHLLNDLEMGIPIIVILAISVFFNIAVCVYKCSQLLASRKSSPTGGNQMSHPEGSLPSGNRIELQGDMHEMTSMPSEMTRSIAPESSFDEDLSKAVHLPDNTAKRHRSRRYEEEQNKVFFGNTGADFNSKLAICRQNNKLRTITKGEDETCKTKTRGQGKSSHEDYSAVYQNVGEDSGAPTSVDMTEEDVCIC